MEERYIAAVDLGTSMVSLMIARVEGNDVQVIYYRRVPSKGIQRGGVTNPSNAAEPVKMLISDAESSLGVKITQVVVGTPRYQVVERAASASFDRTDTSIGITKEEFNSLKEMATGDCPVENPETERVYGCIHQSFSTDEEIQLSDEDDIVGMMSSTFSGNYKLYVGRKRQLDNIYQVFNPLKISIAETYFTPLVVGDVILTSDEKDSGVALIDMGAAITSVSVYKGGVLRHYASIPFGGSTITSDIKLESGFSLRLAENIKLAYGSCTPEKLANLSDKIIRVNYPESGNYRDIKVDYLAQVIGARQKEIINAMLWEIERSGLADDMRSGVVLTGGAAEMNNLSSLLTSMSGYSVRIGYPRNNYSYTGISNARNADAATSIGLIMAAKADPYINCVGIVPASREQSLGEDVPPVDSAVSETEGGNVDTGKLFTEDKADSTKPSKATTQAKAPKAPKPAKAPKEKVHWNRIKSAFTSIDDKIGTLFDEAD